MSSPAAKLETVIVTKDELTELAAAEHKYADLAKKAADAERDVKMRRQQLAEKVLGIKSADELKELPPDKLLKLFEKRWERGDWKAERGAPEFSFVESSHGRYPSWMNLYIGELGETAAARVKAETPISWSYKVAVVTA
jgi:hypothetical protein